MFLLVLYVLYLRIYLKFLNIISRHTVLGLFLFLILWNLLTLDIRNAKSVDRFEGKVKLFFLNKHFNF